jgi:LysR family transcriptional regulator, carnitine catabolism transcriptional activator
MRLNISFRQVELFLALARTLSFSQAARECHISQPALSASIKKLEFILGAKLVDRHTRKVKLTAVGQEFNSLGTMLGESMQHSQLRIREFIEGKRGRLVIAAGPSIAASYAPRTIAAFLLLHPKVEVTLIDALSDQCLEMVRVGTADVALAPGNFSGTEFRKKELFEDKLGAVFPAGHALARKRRALSWADVARYPQVVVNSTGSLRQTIDEEFRRHNVVLKPAYELAQVGTMLGLIREGLGIGVLSRTLMERFDMRQLAFLPINSPSAFRTICFVTSAHRVHAPAVAAYMQVCVPAKQEPKTGSKR